MSYPLRLKSCVSFHLPPGYGFLTAIHKLQQFNRTSPFIPFATCFNSANGMLLYLSMPIEFIPGKERGNCEEIDRHQRQNEVSIRTLSRSLYRYTHPYYVKILSGKIYFVMNTGVSQIYSFSPWYSDEFRTQQPDHLFGDLDVPRNLDHVEIMAIHQSRFHAEHNLLLLVNNDIRSEILLYEPKKNLKSLYTTNNKNAVSSISEDCIFIYKYQLLNATHAIIEKFNLVELRDAAHYRTTIPLPPFLCQHPNNISLLNLGVCPKNQFWSLDYTVTYPRTGQKTNYCQVFNAENNPVIIAINNQCYMFFNDGDDTCFIAARNNEISYYNLDRMHTYTLCMDPNINGTPIFFIRIHDAIYVLTKKLNPRSKLRLFKIELHESAQAELRAPRPTPELDAISGDFLFTDPSSRE